MMLLPLLEKHDPTPTLSSSSSSPPPTSDEHVVVEFAAVVEDEGGNDERGGEYRKQRERRHPFPGGASTAAPASAGTATKDPTVIALSTERPPPNAFAPVEFDNAGVEDAPERDDGDGDESDDDGEVEVEENEEEEESLLGSSLPSRAASGAAAVAVAGSSPSSPPRAVAEAVVDDDYDDQVERSSSMRKGPPAPPRDDDVANNSAPRDNSDSHQTNSPIAQTPPAGAAEKEGGAVEVPHQRRGWQRQQRHSERAGIRAGFGFGAIGIGLRQSAARFRSRVNYRMREFERRNLDYLTQPPPPPQSSMSSSVDENGGVGGGQQRPPEENGRRSAAAAERSSEEGDAAGERTDEAAESSRTGAATKARKAAVAVAGGSLIAVGIPLIPLPGPGDWMVVGGLALLATEYPAAQRVLDNARDRLVEALDRHDEAPSNTEEREDGAEASIDESGGGKEEDTAAAAESMAATKGNDSSALPATPMPGDERKTTENVARARVKEAGKRVRKHAHAMGKNVFLPMLNSVCTPPAEEDAALGGDGPTIEDDGSSGSINQ